MAVTRHPELIEVERIFLYEENPRHEPIESEPEIIEYLCKDEQVFALARSIAEAGTNPLQLLGVIELPNSGSKKSYQVWEGNRRVCALKLLNDSDRAPAHLRKDFVRLASTYTPITKINVVVFDNHDDLKFWMGIIHDGAQKGVGTIAWDAQQKARHFGSNKNRVALAVLDAAEAMGLITKEERSGKITTTQRYLNRPILREALGIDSSNPDDVTFNRPVKDLQKQLGKFIEDLKGGVRVTSRNNSDQIDNYGRRLARNAEISGQRIQPLSLKTAAVTTSPAKPKKKGKPKKLKKLSHLEYDNDLATALEVLENGKIDSLYNSICTIRIEHAPLLTIGVWAFVECLTAIDGRKSDTDFVNYFTNQRLQGHGYTDSKKLNPVRDALKRIQTNGNTTKHHEISALFDGKQLSNDLATITPLLIKVIESIAAKK